MNKQSVLIGWPRYDPQRYRFAIPNTVWEYELKAVEFVILSYICYWQSRSTANSLTPEIVAEGIRMTAATVKKYLSALVSKGLITAELDLAQDLQHISSEKFFTLPNEIFLLRLPPTAFMVYAYLLLIEDRRTHTCHPSYNTIAAATGVAKNTAMKCISVLEAIGLIAVEPSSYLDNRGMKWKGNNLYTILPVKIAVDKFYQRQLSLLDLDVKRQQLHELQEKYKRQHPIAAQCATADTTATLNPAKVNEPLCASL